MLSLRCEALNAELAACSARSRWRPALRICVAVRPEKITISRKPPDGEDRNVLKGVVRDLGYFGDQSLYRVRLPSGAVLQVSAQNLRRSAKLTRRVGRRSVSVVGRLQHDPAARMSDRSHPRRTEERSSWLRRAVVLPYVWLLVFFLTPFLIILKISFAEPIVAQPPFTALLRMGRAGASKGSGPRSRTTLFLFQDGYYGIIYLASLKMAAIGTLLCLLLGYPMAYFIARQPPRRRQMLLLAVILPFWISFLLRVYAWIGLLNNKGVINNLLMSAGRHRSTADAALQRFRRVSRHRLLVPAVHDPAALRESGAAEPRPAGGGRGPRRASAGRCSST